MTCDGEYLLLFCLIRTPDPGVSDVPSNIKELPVFHLSEDSLSGEFDLPVRVLIWLVLDFRGV